MRLAGFIGPSNVDRGYSFDNERTINLYPQLPQAGTPKNPEGLLLGCPGLQPRYALPAGPVRGMFTQNGRAFAIGGASLCELFANQSYRFRGLVATDGQPASFAANGAAGNQLMITSGGLGYIFDLTTNTLAPITDASFPADVAQGEFLNSYFIVRVANSNQFYYSALLDGTDWNGLDYFRTSLTSDNKLAMIANHGDLWLFGGQRTEIWQNVGNQNTPFQPIPGALIEHGIGAAWSAQRLDNSVFWLGGDERGNNIVFKADGYTPSRVSTNAVETYLNNLPRTSDAIGFTYQQDGHAFYLLYVPTAETTLCYDVSTNLWHERAIWDSTLMRWFPMRARNHIFAFGRHLVGDRSSGTIFDMRLDSYVDGVVA